MFKRKHSFFMTIGKRPSYPSHRATGAVTPCPTMASKANICDKYEGDSDKQQVEDKCPPKTLHLSYFMLSDGSIVVRSTPSVCVWIVPQRPAICHSPVL